MYIDLHKILGTIALVSAIAAAPAHTKAADDSLGLLLPNEVTSCNIDRTVDFANCFGGWIELYNPTDQEISLGKAYVSNDPEDMAKFQLPSSYGKVKPGEYICIFFDHNASEGHYGPQANKQVDFKLSADGGTIYLSADGVSPLITIDYPKGMTRCSYARLAVDSDQWEYNGLPTPYAANCAEHFASDRVGDPVVNFDSKLFSDEFDIDVTVPEGATLKYTTDGSAPGVDRGEVLTDGHIHIGKTSTLRFVAVHDGKLPSLVVTRSYIKRDKDYYLPVVAVSTDPDFLYDDYLGVYVDGKNGIDGNGHGKSNLNMNWERPVNFEYITPAEGMVINQETNFEVSGAWSRHNHPASFKLGNDDGSVVLLTAADGSWTDEFYYDQHSSKETYGRYPDGGDKIYRMSVPTIKRRNILSTYDFELSDLDLPTTGIADVLIDDDTAIGIQGSATVVDVTHYDLFGRKLEHPGHGMCLRHVKYADGSVRVEKVAVR